MPGNEVDEMGEQKHDENKRRTRNVFCPRNKEEKETVV